MVEEPSVDLGVSGLTGAVRIGSGGFADVYRARQVHLNRDVAVKVLRAAASDEEARMRFERECHALGAVSGHPNIVGVHGGGFTADGRAYLVMEYCPGGSLADHLRRDGTLPAARVSEIGRKIAGALAVAHAAGVVHRDVKPGNILMTPWGEPALADFGIARVEGGQQTATGQITASVNHAAPEVLEGETPTPASDLYSLGSTLFELFNGRPPHYRPSDESILVMMRRILTEPVPDPVALGMPEPLAAVVRCSTSRHPGQRYASADALIAVLASDPAGGSAPGGSPAAATPSEVTEVVPPLVAGRRWAVITPLLAALVLAAGAGGMWIRSVIGPALDPVVASLADAEVGPLDQDRSYTVSIEGGDEGALWSLLLNGDEVTEPSPTVPVSWTTPPSGGRYSLVVMATGNGGEERSEPIEIYVLGETPAVGSYRANLLAVAIQPTSWPVALSGFDRLVVAGHNEVELLPGERVAGANPDFWQLFVPGFDESQDARDYCVDFGLAVPNDCFPGLIPDGAEGSGP